MGMFLCAYKTSWSDARIKPVVYRRRATDRHGDVTAPLQRDVPGAAVAGTDGGDGTSVLRSGALLSVRTWSRGQHSTRKRRRKHRHNPNKCLISLFWSGSQIALRKFSTLSNMLMSTLLVERPRYQVFEILLSGLLAVLIRRVYHW